MTAPLQKYGGITVWSDADIAAGSNWPSTIQKSLDKAAVAVLLVSRHFLRSPFIMNVEVPYILRAREKRGLKVLWVLVSDCLYKETPFEPIQAALPTSAPLEGMRDAERSAALRRLCEKMKAAWLEYERPLINPALAGVRVKRKMENLPVLKSPARRRVEVFVRADNSADWYHQGPIREGQAGRTCYFGTDKTKPGTGYHIVALTTDLAVPHQGGQPPKPLPKERTRSRETRVIRS